MPPSDRASWQCLLIIWGDKYGVETVNRLVRAVAAHAASEPRFVLLTDVPREGLDDRIISRPIPPEWLLPEMKQSGCMAKLAMFAPGVVPDDLPVVYLDLDSVILGDVGKGVRFLHRPDGLMLLQSAILPMGWPGRLVYRLTGGRRYGRGNSSVVIYHPAHCAFIAQRFMELKRQYPRHEYPPMRGGERFTSWAGQAVIAAVPASFAVKFPTEYMSRIPALGYVWAWLPWVRSRRRNLSIVTLCGDTAKAEVLLTLGEGDRIVDRKRRWLVWSEAYVGEMKRKILDFHR
jgi:hypothetical protein